MTNREKGLALFRDALAQIESESIRDWATSDHNKPLFERHCERVVAKGKDVEPAGLAAYIVCLAIGA